LTRLPAAPPVASGADDLPIDVPHRELVEASTPGASPGFPQPAGGRSQSFRKIVHTHNQHRRLAIPLNQKALVLADGSVHNLAELGAGGDGSDFSGHRMDRIID
jgi:hypothetical protein